MYESETSSTAGPTQSVQICCIVHQMETVFRMYATLQNVRGHISSIYLAFGIWINWEKLMNLISVKFTATYISWTS